MSKISTKNILKKIFKGKIDKKVKKKVSKKKDPPTDHKKFENEENKFEKYFKENL